MSTDIDWTACDKFSEDTCTCARCNSVFRSHAKAVMTPTPMIVSKKPCPKCGTMELKKFSSDSEVMTSFDEALSEVWHGGNGK